MTEIDKGFFEWDNVEDEETGELDFHVPWSERLSNPGAIYKSFVEHLNTDRDDEPYNLPNDIEEVLDQWVLRAWNDTTLDNLYEFNRKKQLENLEGLRRLVVATLGGDSIEPYRKWIFEVVLSDSDMVPDCLSYGYTREEAIVGYFTEDKAVIVVAKGSY